MSLPDLFFPALGAPTIYCLGRDDFDKTWPEAIKKLVRLFSTTNHKSFLYFENKNFEDQPT